MPRTACNRSQLRWFLRGATAAAVVVAAVASDSAACDAHGGCPRTGAAAAGSDFELVQGGGINAAFWKPENLAALGLKQTEVWWRDIPTTTEIWDQSWLVPRLVCGLRFTRGDELRWNFDGAAFQARARDYYLGNGPPPMREVWFLLLYAGIPQSVVNDVVSGADLLDMRCAAVYLLAKHIYFEYLIPIVPVSVMLKLFQHGWRTIRGDRSLDTDPVFERHLHAFQPLPAAMERLDSYVDRLRERAALSQTGGEPPLVDVVIVHCREDLEWLFGWLHQVLFLEWTPETPGVSVRILVYEACEPDASREMLGEWVRLGAIAEGSKVVDVRDPPGFENVGFVHYFYAGYWREAEYAFFLHGSPGDHLDMQTLGDVLRAMALRSFDVPFLHLNTKRMPMVDTRGCVGDLLTPALAAWAQAIGGGPGGEGGQAGRAPYLPIHLSAYCCAQFVVSRDRARQVPQEFWQAVWAAFERLERFDEMDELPPSCHRPAIRLQQRHQKRHGLWGVILESAYHWIFGEAAELPLRDTELRLPLYLRVPRPRSLKEGGPRGTTADFVDLPDWGFDPGLWGNMPGAGLDVGGAGGVGLVPNVSAVPTMEFANAGRSSWTLPARVAAWAAAAETAHELAQAMRAAAEASMPPPADA